MSLSDKRKDSYTAEDLKEGLYRGKDVKALVCHHGKVHLPGQERCLVQA